MSNTEILLVALIFAVIAVLGYLYDISMRLERIQRWHDEIDELGEQAERELRNYTGD